MGQVAPARQRTVARHRSAAARTPLLERRSERAAVHAALDAAAAGTGRLLLIEGPAGIGKTSVLDLAREDAAKRSTPVLSARGAELEREFAFGVARQLFEPPLRAATHRERRRLLHGAAGQGAGLLGFDVPAAAAEPAPPPPQERLFAVIHGLYWLSANLAERSPLLMLVDDVQLADDASLRFLAFLARRISELPVALVIARRTGEPVAATPTLEALAQEADRCAPGPLSEEAVSTLVRAELGRAAEPEFVSACHAVTGGNPFFVRELLTSVAVDGIAPVAAQAPALARVAPANVARGVLLRLARLPPGATALARAVAILGGDAELRLAALLAGLEAGTAAGACDALQAVGVLRAGRPLGFVHAIVRATILADIPEAERRLEHRRAAALLERDGARPELVAAQLLESEPAGEAWVVDRLSAAADAAIQRGSPEAAAVHLRRALAEPPPVDQRPALLRRLGSVEALAAQPAGVEHLTQALEAAAPGRPRADIARDLARLLVVLGRFVDAVAVLDRVLAELSRSDGEIAMELEAEAATIGRLHPSTCAGARRRLRRFADGPAGGTPGERLLLATLAFQRTIDGGPARVASAYAQQAIAKGLLADQSTANPTLIDALGTLVYADEFEAAAAFGEAIVAEARASGSFFGSVAPTCIMALAKLWRGAILEAEADAGAALQAAEVAAPSVVPMAGAFLIDALIERGELDEAATVLERCGGEDIGQGLPHLFLLDSRGRLRLAAGDTGRGLADLLKLSRRAERWRTSNPGWLAYRSSAALALAQLGESAEARRLAREELELARDWGAPRATGIALRAMGLVEGGEAGIELLREAVSTLAPSPARLEHARALTDLGAALRRANRRAEARAVLGTGFEEASACGALALLERCRTELNATGARPRRAVLMGVEALTASERRIAEMAAAGMSNPEIAQTLFVTRKTVETHLGNAYRKLGIRSRDALPGLLR